jgi:hypothetical protein
MYEYKIKWSEKISENGIKKLIINGNTLIMLDCDHNIILFDIIR